MKDNIQCFLLQLPLINGSLKKEKIIEAVNNVKDDKTFYDMLYYNKLISAFEYNVRENGIYGELDQEKVRNIYKKNEEYKKRKKEQDEMKYKINDVLENKKIDYIYIKGVPMQHYVYQNSEIRISSDLDLLISEENIERAAQALEQELGFSMIATDQEKKIYRTLFQHIAPLKKENVFLDLHFRITQKDDGYYLNTNEFLNGKIYTKDNLPITSMEDTLINICYHHYQHEYRENRYQIRILADIYNFVYKNKDEMDWELIIDKITKYKIEFPILYSLFFVNEVYDLKVSSIPGLKKMFDKFIHEDFLKEKDGILSRHLFCNKPFGYWKEPYLERMFWNVWELRTKICIKYFLFITEEMWREKSKELGVDYEKIYDFTTKSWERIYFR